MTKENNIIQTKKIKLIAYIYNKIKIILFICKNRDLSMIGKKLKYVLIPKFTIFGASRTERMVQLRNCKLMIILTNKL